MRSDQEEEDVQEPCGSEGPTKRETRGGNCFDEFRIDEVWAPWDEAELNNTELAQEAVKTSMCPVRERDVERSKSKKMVKLAGVSERVPSAQKEKRSWNVLACDRR